MNEYGEPIPVQEMNGQQQWEYHKAKVSFEAMLAKISGTRHMPRPDLVWWMNNKYINWNKLGEMA